MRIWAHRPVRVISCNTRWTRAGLRGWWEYWHCIYSSHWCLRSYYHCGDCRCVCGAVLTIAEQDALL